MALQGIVSWFGNRLARSFAPAVTNDVAEEEKRVSDPCAGCDAVGEFAAVNGKHFCPSCCPQLYCEDCLSATGGSCRVHAERED